MKTEYSDYELIDLIRQNDEEALNILLEKYSLLIGKIASSFYGVSYDQQDFFQEGRMAFIKAIETFDENSESTFYSYSMTCVRNSITTTYRKLRRSAGFEKLVDDTATIDLAYSNRDYRYVERLDNLLSEKVIIEEVLSEKNILSDLEKECLKYYLLDNNYKEIAEILGISPKKADNALNRCKCKLKNLNKVNNSDDQNS